MVDCVPEAGIQMIEKLLTVEEVAENLRVTAYTVREHLKSGRLRGMKIGKLWRIKESDLEAFIKGKEEQ